MFFILQKDEYAYIPWHVEQRCNTLKVETQPWDVAEVPAVEPPKARISPKSDINLYEERSWYSILKLSGNMCTWNQSPVMGSYFDRTNIYIYIIVKSYKYIARLAGPARWSSLWRLRIKLPSETSLRPERRGREREGERTRLLLRNRRKRAIRAMMSHPKKEKRKVIKPPKLKKVKWKLLGMLRRRIAPRNPRVKLKMKMGIRCMDVAGAAMLLKGAALARTQILSQEVPVHPKNPLMLTRSTGWSLFWMTWWNL